MKVQVINTDFLHDGTYYYQNSIIDLPPELIRKYPRNLLTLDVPDKTKEIETSEMIQDNSDLPDVSGANNMPVPSGLAPSAEIINPKVSKKNKRGRKC